MSLAIWLCAAFLLVLVFIGFSALSRLHALQLQASTIESYLKYDLPETIGQRVEIGLIDITDELKKIRISTDYLEEVAPKPPPPLD